MRTKLSPEQKILRVARYVLRLARERERDGLDSAACHRTFQALIRALPVAFRGDIPPRRLAELESVLDRFMRDFNKEVTFSDKTLDNSTISGKIKLRNPKTDGKSEGDWVTINGTHVQIGKGGQITKGPANLKGQPIASAGPKRPENEPEILKRFNRYEPGSKTEAEKLAQVNPTKDDKNCQRCVVAYEMIERGYNVAAKPFNPSDSIGYSGFAAWKFDNDNPLLDSNLFPIKAKEALQPIVKGCLDIWGNGSRAVIRIEWDKKFVPDGERGHFISVKRVGNHIRYSDSQGPETLDMNLVLKACTNQKGRMWIMRVDNREFSDSVVDAVQNVEE